MFHLLKATQVTPGDQPAPDAAPDDADVLRWLADLYTPPTPASGRPQVRFNMIASVDGAVTRNGKSGDLGGDGDKALFRVLRGLADIVLVGAKTATVEGYGLPPPDEVFAADRTAAGKTGAPALALLSRSLDIPADFGPLTSPDTAVLTCRSAPGHRRIALLDAGARVVDCGEDTVDPAAVVRWCAQQGHLSILSEGGPTLLGAFLQADLVDELCVTTSPMAVSGDAGRIAHDDAPATDNRLRPAVILTDDDDFVYLRWVRPT